MIAILKEYAGQRITPALAKLVADKVCASAGHPRKIRAPEKAFVATEKGVEKVKPVKCGDPPLKSKPSKGIIVTDPKIEKR